MIDGVPNLQIDPGDTVTLQRSREIAESSAFSIAASAERRARVVVTGASGFVGSHICAVLKQDGHEVIGLDLAPASQWIGLDEFLICDVTDRRLFARLIENVQPDALILAAAITPGDDELNMAQTIVDVNQHAALTGLLAAARVSCRRVVYLSSAGVYADPQPGMVLTEDSPVANDGGLYAQTKLASERLCQWAARELGLLTTALRVGPVYGEFERPTNSRSRMSPIYRAIELASGGESIRCRYQETIYNWIYGDDVGRAVACVLDAPHPQGVYNLGGRALSMAETLEALGDVIPEMRYEWTSDPNVENLRVSSTSRQMSSDLMQRDLDFRPITELRDGVREILTSNAAETD